MGQGNSNKFSAVIIGSGSLPVRCSELILAKGHEIRAIVSSDPAVTSWARSTAISQVDPGPDLARRLDQPFDYLFSIVNEHILRDDVLQLPKKLAINYHDSPLPRYAGTHATSWALLNGEKRHGITWHLIAEKVDAGDIVKQVEVEIGSDETALSLNTKCYEAAIEAFDQLIDELAERTWSRQKQDLSKRTFFPLYKRPENACMVSWDRPATQISALGRALSFGKYPNALGTPKVAIGNELFVLSEFEITEVTSSSTPGTISQIGKNAVQVSTADHDIVLKRVHCLNGQPIELGEIADRHKLSSGQKLDLLDAEARQAVDETYKETCRHENYWLEKLLSLHPVATPFAKKAGSEHTSANASVSLNVPDAFQRMVRGSGDKDGQNAFLITAFGALLTRLTGTDSFDAGYRIERPTEISGPNGLFANTLPVRFEVDLSRCLADGVESFVGEFERVKDRGTYAVDIVMRYPQLDSVETEADVFPIGFAEVCNTGDFSIPTGNELTLALSSDECRFYFDPEKLDRSDVEKLAEHFEIFLNSAANDPERPVGELSILSERERNLLLSEWQGERADYPADKTIPQLFTQQVAKTPDDDALTFGDRRLTYRELNEKANQLAHHLINSGLQERDLVGISIARSFDLVIAVLGVLKAGGTYVPLDPSLPSERLKFIAEDTGLKVVLTQDGFTHQLNAQLANVISLDAVRQRLAESPVDDPLIDVGSSDPAYVIYTSGSTGNPKGVLVSHRSLVNHAFGITHLYELNSRDRVLQFASFNFDVAAEELFPSLLCGATVVLLPQEIQNSLKLFSEFLSKEKLTVLNLPASYWRQWTSTLAGPGGLLPDSLRLLITGSERVLPEDYNAWRKVVDRDVRWLNAYGLTETTITSIVFDPIEFYGDQDLSVIPIGRPIRNTEVYMLGKDLQPVPVGIPGEMYIGGDCLALGYLDRPSLTDEKFVQHPFDPTPNAKLYRTGDLARYLPNGAIEYLDRTDNQVKVRGYRIELGEIEAALASHAGLSEAVVIADKNSSGDAGLVAYFVAGRADERSKNSSVELWASVGEYPIYDELMYYALSTDEGRTSRYTAAISRLVKDKVVVEIGTGRDLILARLCVAAGAKKVYAIEALEDSYLGAKALIESQGLAEKIVLLKGFSTYIELPEKADVCVSEIIGTIGGSEGVVPILNDARRFLKDDGRMIPERCVTKIAAVQMPDGLLESPRFSKLSEKYARKIFDSVGYEFDVRVCVQDLPKENWLSESGIFEDLDFSGSIRPDSAHEITLRITESGRLDGFLLWLNLYTASDLVIDNSNEESSWLPVFFPAFEHGIDVVPGDVIQAVCRSVISDNGFNPDYSIEGILQRQNGESVSFKHDSFHHKPDRGKSLFYQRLFDEKKDIDPASLVTGTSVNELRDFLSASLPDYMIPSSFVEMDQMPMTPSGKIDRRALPSSAPARSVSEKEIVDSRDDLESKLVGIWEDVLGVHPIGIRDDFFELGGHSLKAIRMFAEIESAFGKNIPLATLFSAGTIEKLADILRQDGWSEPESSLVPIQPNGTKPVFFCVHAKGGNVLFYKDLAKRLGDDQPFYGIQARRLGGRQVAHATVEEMADYYVNEIKSIQPKGPYFLGGASFGGLGAFEIAIQLRQRGEAVAMLALFDTGTPDYPKRLSTTTNLRAKGYRFVRRSQLHRDSLKAFNAAERKEYIAGKLNKAAMKYWRKLINVKNGIARKYVHWNPAADRVPDSYVKIEDQIEKAGLNYKPQTYAGKMTLFRATNQPLGIVDDATLGWDRYVDGGIEIHHIPGYHGTIVAEPYVRVLADELSECIEIALSEQSFESSNGKGSAEMSSMLVPATAMSTSTQAAGRIE